MKINSQDIKKINYLAQSFLPNDVTYRKFNLDLEIMVRASSRFMCVSLEGFAGNRLLNSTENDGTKENLLL